MAVLLIVQGSFRILPQHGQVPETGAFLVFGSTVAVAAAPVRELAGTGTVGIS
jgi:hypothetical protein